MGWSRFKTNPSKTSGNTYIGFYFNYNINVKSINPLVFELIASEVHDDVVVFNFKNLQGEQKEIADSMVDKGERDLTS